MWLKLSVLVADRRLTLGLFIYQHSVDEFLPHMTRFPDFIL